MQNSGISLILDLSDCQSPAIGDEDLLIQLFEATLHQAGFDVVDSLMHRFPVQGTTFIYILKQSHAILHTWPESSFVSIDVYACGRLEDVRPVLETVRNDLAQKLVAGSVRSELVIRGA